MAFYVGTKGANLFAGSARADNVSDPAGGDRHDTNRAAAGSLARAIVGTPGDDTLNGTADPDLNHAYGGAGDDTVTDGLWSYGGDGDDFIEGRGERFGDAGDDTRVGGSACYGGAGADLVDSNQLIDGGYGDDTLRNTSLYGGDMFGGPGDDALIVGDPATA